MRIPEHIPAPHESFVCPNCFSPSPENSQECEFCDALFCGDAAWRPVLASTVSPALLLEAKQHRVRRPRSAAPAQAQASPPRPSTEKEKLGLCYPLAWISLLLALAPVAVFFLARGETGFLAGWLMIGITPPALGFALVFWLLGFVARRLKKK